MSARRTNRWKLHAGEACALSCDKRRIKLVNDVPLCEAHAERAIAIAEDAGIEVAVVSIAETAAHANKAPRSERRANAARRASAAPDAVRVRACEHCGKEFEQRGAGAPRKRCDDCRPQRRIAPPRCHCGALIPWNGHSRPAKECPACESPRTRYLRERQRTKDAAKREAKERAA